MKTFCIVYSNYTMALFAWEGTPQENITYLGNREILGTVVSASADLAIESWRAKAA